MCGRYYVDADTVREIEKIVREADAKLFRERKGDVYPSQTAPVITGKKPYLTAEEMRWGFPKYQQKGLIINARSETAPERRMFREGVLKRRVIIPAGHFYEWDSKKNKVTFLREHEPALYMAGFYNRFGKEERFIILTTQANGSVSPVHHRMPLILEKGELENWIYDEKFAQCVLTKTLPMLRRQQEYEQQTLFFDHSVF